MNHEQSLLDCYQHYCGLRNDVFLISKCSSEINCSPKKEMKGSGLYHYQGSYLAKLDCVCFSICQLCHELAICQEHVSSVTLVSFCSAWQSLISVCVGIELYFWQWWVTSIERNCTFDISFSLSVTSLTSFRCFSSRTDEREFLFAVERRRNQTCTHKYLQPWALNSQ